MSRARFTDDDPAGDYIPGSLDRVIAGGVTIEPSRRLFGSIRLRHFGPRPLVEDNSVISRSTTIWNGEAGYNASGSVRLVLSVFNVFDAKVSDIDYDYASRLRGAGRGRRGCSHASGDKTIGKAGVAGRLLKLEDC